MFQMHPSILKSVLDHLQQCRDVGNDRNRNYILKISFLKQIISNLNPALGFGQYSC